MQSMPDSGTYAEFLATLALDTPPDHPLRRILGAGEIPSAVVVEALETVLKEAVDAGRQFFCDPRDPHVDGERLAYVYAHAVREAISTAFSTLADLLAEAPTATAPGGAA